MKSYFRRIISMILVIAIFANIGLTGLAEAAGVERKSSGDVFSFTQEITWAEAGKQIAGMLSFIVEDAANIDLDAYSERITNLSLEDDSIYLAILAEAGYLPEEPEKIDPAAAISTDEYVHLMEAAFPAVVDSQAAVDSLAAVTDLSNVAILGDDLSVTTLLAERLAVAAAQQLSLTAVKASALSLNAGSSVELNGSEVTRVHIHDTAVKEESEKDEPDLIYIHMDSDTELPEVIVKGADEVIIEGSGALGVVRVQEAVGALTVRATGSVINETDEAFEVTGPDAEVVELQPGEQVDFVLSKWLVSFVTEGTSVETQQIAPGGMVDFTKAVTTLEGKIFTAWYEDAEYTTPVSRLSSVDREMTLYARFIDESEAAIVTFETFGGRELEPMVFAKGEYLLTKPVETLYTSKEGYSFGGWCADEECTTAFGYTTPIEESMTLYAMYSSYEQEVREDPGTVAELELPDGAAAIGLVLPEGMTAAEALDNITVEFGTGLEAPEIAVRETGSGAEVYCEAGFTPGTSFTLNAQNGVQFAGYPEYIDTLRVSIFREQVETVQFAEGLTYVLWDNVTDYTPVSKTAVEYTSNISEDGTIHEVMEDHDAQGDVIPGKLVMTGEVGFQPEQIVVFYDGEINRDEATIDSWEGGDLAGHVLFAKIESVETKADGTSEVIFTYADPETYITEMDVHTTEEVDLEENLTEEQIGQIEKAIASQLAANDELKAQMMVAVMTSEEAQRMLDEKYGANTYSLAALVPYVSDPKLDIELSVEGSTAFAAIGVGITVSLYGPQGLLATLTPYLYFEEQLTIDIGVDGGFLWVDLGVMFKTKTTVSLQLKATTGDDMDILEEAKTTLEEIVRADGTAVEDYDYQEAADTLMNTMQELISAELEYQDLFAVPLLKLKYTFYGIVTVGINVELVGQAACVATFGVTVTAEYGQRIGFNYNFKKFKGGSYKEKLASEVTTEVYLIGKIGVRVGISVTLYLKLLQNVTVGIAGAVYAYVELAGMFMYTYALSAGGGNYAGALYLEVGIDAEIELVLEVEILFIAVEKSWTLWSDRWPLYSKTIGMTMSVVQRDELDAIWEKATEYANGRASFVFPYLPMKTYDMLDASCVENQLLFEDLQEGNVTAKLTLENVYINGELVAADDPRISVIVVGDGSNGQKPGTLFADEMAAAAYKVTDFACDVVLTYENKNKSELIKKHRQVFPFAREFKMSTTTVNIDINLYDWCAHTWGIEAAEWDNATVLATTLENTHVLGCPVEPSATGTIDLDAVIAAAMAAYPELADMELSWFDPTLNPIKRTVQYSIPHISNLCYLTPDSNTVRFDIFETSKEFNLTYNLFVSRFSGFNGKITYIIEAPEAPADAVFTVIGGNSSALNTFTPVEGEPNRWSLTVNRTLFNGTERPIMMRLNGGAAVVSGLTVTGREAENEVVLTLKDLAKKLTIETPEGIESWHLVNLDPARLTSMLPGEKVTISTVLKEGYDGLRVTSEPEGLDYTVDGSTVSFNMPSRNTKVIISGVRQYQVNYQYNYGELGTYLSIDAKDGDSFRVPSDPYVQGLTFAGWYDNADCEGDPFDFTQKVTDNITLYADWRANVTVDFGGAKGPARYVTGRHNTEIDGDIVVVTDSELIFPGDQSDYSRFTYFTQKLGENALEIVVPNYNGHDFDGWYLTSDGSGDPVDPTQYTLTGGVTFYARWKQIAIVSYELNYGEQEEPYSMSIEYVGMPLQHIPDAPQRENYEFVGWSRAADGGRPVDLNTYSPTGDATLYACWKPADYTITYELSGGENNPANPGSYNIESADITFGEPTRTGYSFVGWEMTGIETPDGTVYIPAGSTGNVTLTAKWQPVVYTITFDLVRGELAAANPAEYTIESEAIVLNNPTAKGYRFTGWTGTGLTEPTIDVVIPAGSTGNRSYKANWATIDSIGSIVDAALAAIPSSATMSVNDFTGIQDVRTLALDALAADAVCADYLDQLTVTVSQVGQTVEDGTGYSYTVRVTVSFTDDTGNTVAKNKNVALTVAKIPVTITASVSYPAGSNYIPYGAALADVALNGTAVSNGTVVEGTFRWADSTIVPKSADNGVELYKVVFTPADAANYSTAETLIAVNAQIGVLIVLDAPDTVEYTGRALTAGECAFYAAHVDTGERIDGITLILSGAVLTQSRLTPGTATVTLKEFASCDIQGNVGGQYGIADTAASDTVTITRANTTIQGTVEYTIAYGSKLSDIELAMNAVAADGVTSVAGTIAWENPATVLNEVGKFTHTVIFTPADQSCYNASSMDVTVNVNGYPGKITYLINAPDAPADSAFRISGTAEVMNFVPVEGQQNFWSLTVNRAAFDGVSTFPILLQRSGSAAIETGLTVTGREEGSQIILTLNVIPRALSVSYADGVDSWTILSHDPSELDAIAPGDQVTISANLLGENNLLCLTSTPEGLSYFSDGNTVTFTMPAHDVAIELYGVKTYQVTCLYNYNDMGTFVIMRTAEDGSIVMPEPSVEGLTFVGWFDNAECQGEAFDFTQKISSNITLYADWRVNVTVDFGGQKGIAAYYPGETGGEQVPDDGTDAPYQLIFPDDETEYERYTYATQRVGETMLSLVLPMPEGYVFNGWYLTEDHTGEEVDLYGYVLTGGVTFYADWLKYVTLTYMFNDGKDEKPFHTATEYVGKPIEQNLPETPARDGYEFLGWFSTPECGEDDLIDFDTYLVPGDMTLYAGWKAVDYTITYDLDGGTNDPSNPDTYTVESDRIDFARATRDGYTCLGWIAESPAMGNDAFDAWLPAGSTGDVVLTAIWEPVSYDIHYDLLGGENDSSNPDAYTIESEAITLASPTRSGYTFLGWTGTDLTEPTMNVTIPAGSVGQRSYTANWELAV
ncbi:MAG: InlB B-repeat-containing protein, partial [Aristaeellaceae bacterium]